jgi:hypothetical protein
MKHIRPKQRSISNQISERIQPVLLTVRSSDSSRQALLKKMDLNNGPMEEEARSYRRRDWRGRHEIKDGISLIHTQTIRVRSEW